jgi:pimeloyl-ACP methyl ester carboxylesterase
MRNPLFSLRSRSTYGAAAALTVAAGFVHLRAWQAERASPPRGRLVDVEGTQVHYLERGDGPPLVVLHGLGSMTDEVALSPFFALAAQRYRVLLVDRPGYGHSTRPGGAWWGPQRQAALLHAFFKKLGLERPLLLGHSFGALVALAYALAHGPTLRGLVLASGYYFPTARLDAPLMAAPAIPFLGRLMRHTISPLIGRAMWPGMLRLQFAPAPVPAYFSRFPVWMTLRASQLRAAAEESALLVPATLALRRRYAGLEIAPVIVAGARDRYVDPQSHSLRLARAVPRAELIVAGRAGHMVHHTDPRRVLQAVHAADIPS